MRSSQDSRPNEEDSKEGSEMARAAACLWQHRNTECRLVMDNSFPPRGQESSGQALRMLADKASWLDFS